MSFDREDIVNQSIKENDQIEYQQEEIKKNKSTVDLPSCSTKQLDLLSKIEQKKKQLLMKS
jgi:hypothetical protein